MYKLIVLFTRPADIAQFEDNWANKFMPYAEGMPGIRRVQVNTMVGTPDGPAPYYKSHEFYFDSLADLYAALDSDAGVKAGHALMSFAADLATILYADVLEDDRHHPHLALTPPNEGE